MSSALIKSTPIARTAAHTQLTADHVVIVDAEYSAGAIVPYHPSVPAPVSEAPDRRALKAVIRWAQRSESEAAGLRGQLDGLEQRAADQEQRIAELERKLHQAQQAMQQAAQMEEESRRIVVTEEIARRSAQRNSRRLRHQVAQDHIGNMAAVDDWLTPHYAGEVSEPEPETGCMAVAVAVATCK